MVRRVGAHSSRGAGPGAGFGVPARGPAGLGDDVLTGHRPVQPRGRYGPRTARAIDLVVGERASGPVFLDPGGVLPCARGQVRYSGRRSVHAKQPHRGAHRAGTAAAWTPSCPCTGRTPGPPRRRGHQPPPAPADPRPDESGRPGMPGQPQTSYYPSGVRGLNTAPGLTGSSREEPDRSSPRPGALLGALPIKDRDRADGMIDGPVGSSLPVT
jgi:hypothetical protein